MSWGSITGGTDFTGKTTDDLAEGSTNKYLDYPDQATCWHDEAQVESGNALSRLVDSTQAYGVQVRQSPPANGDKFKQQVFLKAGTYEFHVLGYESTDRGMIDWSLDGTNFATGQDWYDSSSAANVEKTVTGITVSTSGYHTLQGTINGKNASSSDYMMSLTKYWFIRTGA